MSKNKKFLAVDLGASHGRVILAEYNGKILELDTVHNFINNGININGHLHWNILQLYKEIKNGVRKAVKNKNNIHSLGVDSWGVDYALLDKTGTLMSLPYHYRDKRTDGIFKDVFAKLSKKEIYMKTGNQFLQLNTLFQLYVDKLKRPWIIENAEDLLFIPDLMNYFLTGRKFNEHTIASTSQLLNPIDNNWERTLFEKLDLKKDMMGEIIYPANKIGEISAEIKADCGIKNNLSVIAVGSHDTASAVAAAPLIGKKSAYISSGTWSLLGLELEKPIINEESLKSNFTNEAGLERKIRFLKNLTGLWLIQESKKIWNKKNKKLDYNQISSAAKNSKEFLFKIDPDHHDFLNPDNMIEAIKNYCKKTDQYIPQTIGEIARGIYESLAFKYQEEINNLEKLSNKKIDTINIVGGGSRADILCQITSNICNKEVVAGPVEATAAGNILAQLIAAEEIKDLKEGRQLIKDSFKLKKYHPKN